ncbi:OmpA family protein [bacterium SCSIO 12741]|nr:OmpA family protein [bacterium SCSIO 12741]
MRIQTLSCLLLALLFGAMSAVAQDDLTESQKKKLLKQARDYMQMEEFREAFKSYSELHKSDTANPNYNYELGICIYEGSFNKVASKKYFESALEKGNRADMPEMFYYLGRVYHLEHNFLFALAAYNTYLVEGLPKGKVGRLRKKEVESYIQQCDEGKDLIEKDQNLLDRVDRNTKNVSKFYVEGNKFIRIENLGDEVNSAFSEYGPIIMNNNRTLVFTSRRTGSTGGEVYSDGQYFEDIYEATNRSALWTDVQNVNNSKFFNGALVNSKKHNATVSISPDESQLFVYVDNHIDVLENDGENWLEPRKFSETFSRAGNQVTSATISPDGNKLYVAADRFDCIGGRDLFVSERDSSGKWGELVNMGPGINTELNEATPYMLDDTTLFFSSAGHSSIGGYDVFVSYRSDTGWSKPQNLEIPINSPFDEVNYMLGHDRSHAYYASNRSGGYGEYDIYRITKGVDMNIDESMLAKLEAEERELSEGDSTATGGPELIAGGIEGEGEGLPEGGKQVLLLNDISLDESGNLDSATVARLDEAAEVLNKDPNFTAQIVATGAGVGAAEDARKRALKAYNNLIDSGIEPSRIEVSYTGMGQEGLAGATEMEDGRENLKGAPGSAAASSAPLTPKYEENVYFGFNSKLVTEYSQGKLAKLLAFLEQNPDVKIYMSGHSDHVGNESYNLKLSEKRVLSVKEYLEGQGVKQPIRTEFFGESSPRFAIDEVTSDPDKQIYNRRVKIVVF